jgi:hypothetical protein
MRAFRARLVPIKGGGHYVVVTDAIAAAAGVKLRDRVRGTVEGVAYRSSLARYSGEFHVGVQNAVLRAAGVTTGATVAMTLEPDPDPPPGEVVPDDLAAALAASPQARLGFEHMGPAHRREHVKYVTEAVKPETRQRRIAATIATLEAHADETAARRAAREVAKPKPRKTRRR